jgi:hypothetical protein
VSRRRVSVRWSPVTGPVVVQARREPPPTSRARFPFIATITRRDGRTYEVEVTERRTRFVRWLPHTTRNGCPGRDHSAANATPGRGRPGGTPRRFGGEVMPLAGVAKRRPDSLPDHPFPGEHQQLALPGDRRAA